MSSRRRSGSGKKPFLSQSSSSSFSPSPPVLKLVCTTSLLSSQKVASPGSDNANKAHRRRRPRVAPPPARLAWPGRQIQALSSQDESPSNRNEDDGGDDDAPVATRRTKTATKNKGPSPFMTFLNKTSNFGRCAQNNNGGTSQRNSSSTTSIPPPPPLLQPPSNKRSRYSKNNVAFVSAAAKKQKNASSSFSSCLQEEKLSNLWIDKHCPLSSLDLAVAPKKVKQVTTWLQENYSSSDGGGGLLLLLGAPGVGKSTMIKVLCRELHLDVSEWTESFYQYYHQQQQQQGSPFEQQTPLQHFQQFLHQNAVGYNSLVVEEVEEQEETEKKMMWITIPSNKRQKGAQRKLQWQQQQPLSAPPTTTALKRRRRRRLILLDELPYCHSDEQKQEMKETLTQHILNSKVPTVWIWSNNILEGKLHNPADLEALVEPWVLYNTNVVTFTTVNPATLAKFQSILKRISQAEGIASLLPSTWISEIHVKSGGDIRFAIHAMQYEWGSGGNTAIATATNQQSLQKRATTYPQADRDVRLSTFHALGKVLYAKRKTDVPKTDYVGGEAPLDFDPEGAIEHSGMELPGSIHFIQYHSLDFFTDISEISVAWDLYSDAIQMLESSRAAEGPQLTTNMADGSTSHGALGFAAASSLAGRAVAYSNHHPAPTKFRQFSKPKSLQVISQRKSNQWRLNQYYCNNSSAATRFQHSRQAFATEIYPYGRLMAAKQQKQLLQQTRYSQSTGGDIEEQEEEEEDWYTSSFWGGPPLQSFLAGPKTNNNDNMARPDSAEQEDALKQKVQEEVLRQDDICDFDENDYLG